MRKNNCISLYKAGKFYNAFGDDGLVLHELLGYRYIEHRQSVGFPESAFLKVKTKLEEERISYEVYEKNEIVVSFKGIQKNYANALKKAVKNTAIEERINRIKTMIDACSTEELEMILRCLEDGKFKQE